MDSKIKLFFLLAIYNIVSVQGACPDVPSIDYEFAKIGGVWNDIAISKNDFKFGDVFAKTAYTIEGDEVRLIAENVTNDDRGYVKGHGKRLPNGKIKINYTVGYPRLTVVSSLSVLELNDDFLVLYACVDSQNPESDLELVWISSRVEKPEGRLKEKVDDYLKTFKSPPSLGNITWQKKY